MNRAERRKKLKEMTPFQYESRVKNIEKAIREDCEKYYEKEYQRQLGEAIDNFILTIVYTLHFNEKTKFRRQKNRRFYGGFNGNNRWFF